MAIGGFSITALRNNFMDPSNPYIFVPFVLMIPSSRNYTSFEKLFLPFSPSLWIAVVLIFSISIIAIIGIKISSRKLRDLVIGPKNRGPFLNMTNALFGGSLEILPKRNFARFLLMVLILYTLIMRTVYQGALFNNMQSEDRTTPISTVTELMRNEFNFYMTGTVTEHVKSLYLYKRFVNYRSTFSNLFTARFLLFVDQKSFSTINLITT